MRRFALALVLVSTAAFAAPRNVQIKKKGGEVFRATVVQELESGYLLKLESGTTQAIKFEDIADLTELGGANVPPPPPPSARGAPPGPGAPPPPAPPGAALPAPKGPCAPTDVFLQLDERDNTSRFCVGKTEVTVASYKACVDAGKCDADGLECRGAANWGKAGKENHPINCVSFFQAEAYCTWRQARLPTYDEWISIADSVTPGDYSWGEGEPGGRACWSGDESREGTCAVGTYPRGAGKGGVLDIVGNVWEWTTDEKRRDRIFVGGSWAEKNKKKLYPKSKNWASPGSHFEDLGFRCVRQLPAPAAEKY